MKLNPLLQIVSLIVKNDKIYFNAPDCKPLLFAGISRLEYRKNEKYIYKCDTYDFIAFALKQLGMQSYGSLYSSYVVGESLDYFNSSAPSVSHHVWIGYLMETLGFDSKVFEYDLPIYSKPLILYLYEKSI